MRGGCRKNNPLCLIGGRGEEGPAIREEKKTLKGKTTKSGAGRGVQRGTPRKRLSAAGGQICAEKGNVVQWVCAGAETKQTGRTGDARTEVFRGGTGDQDFGEKKGNEIFNSCLGLWGGNGNPPKMLFGGGGSLGRIAKQPEGLKESPSKESAQK